MDAEPVEPAETAPDAGSAVVTRRFKSYKRKYGKQKVKFEHAMREGNSLVKEEIRIHNLSKRLKEQNDQILELLLELNGSIHVPPNLRFGLEVPDAPLLADLAEAKEAPALIECDAQTAREKLNDAKGKLLAGQMTVAECRELEQSMLMRSNTFAPGQQYSSLRSIPHATLTGGEHAPYESDLESTLGFMKPEDELDYPNTLDTTNGHGDGNLPSNGRSLDKLSPISREKEIAYRNPVSVYNWLRKNQPQVFANDGEPQTTEKQPAPRQGGPRTSKRPSAVVPRDEDMYDDDGIFQDIPEPTTTGAKGKRKRDEDAAYHPKGGRPKKKKEDKRLKKQAVPSSPA